MDNQLTVEATSQSGTVTVENESMSTGIAHRYAADHVLRTGERVPDAFDPADMTVSHEPDIE
jgi:hypothetical protein